MNEFPHHYSVAAVGTADGDVALQAARLPTLHSAPPIEFEGPGDRWSPETLLVAAVADCFLLTFRAVARASTLSWTSLRCEVDGTLDRVERAMQFTRFDLRARLHLPPGVGAELAQRALQKAEQACLITNSLKAETHLESSVYVGSESPTPTDP